jgi:hypothetical protein
MPREEAHMRRIALALAALAALAAGQSATTTVSAQAGWTTLFDGTTTANFNQLGDANWQLEDFAARATMGGGYLVTRESYGDFDLTLEFWVSPDANSGVFIRASDPNEITAANSYEVNIFDSRPDQTYRTGGIVNVAAPAEVIMTGNQWNTMQIVARGDAISVILNGRLVVDAVRDSQFARGPIAFQYGAGEVRFRNIRIRPL